MKKEKTAAKAAKPAASKALVPKASRTLATTAQPDIADLLAQDAGAGQENMDRNDYAIPRLRILQDLSAQVKKTEAGYIKGAEAGMLCDTVSEELWDGDEGVLVIPVSYRRSHIEWKLREKGGGIVKDHGPDGAILDQCTQDDRKRNILPNGNQIVVVAEYFVFLLTEDGGHQPYVLGLAGTQLKKSRRWNTMINQLRIPNPSGEGTINPAMFYRTYRLSTEPERNDQGSWFGLHITPDKPTVELDNGVEIYMAAREFRKQVQSGNVKVAADNEDASAGHAADEGDM
jgi:hypothetical protein